MKAFLSHSSKDKSFVGTVADLVGAARCEYDSYSFEYTLTSEALRKALRRCDLFVLFLSDKSINSSWVSEETRTALDLRSQGALKRVLIFTLDDTSYRQLPEWMQSINVVSRFKSPQTCARKIDAELFALEAEADKAVDIYIPRTEEEKRLRQALRRPPGEAPIAIHAVGPPGIGRRTYLRKTLSSVFPRQIQSYVPITLQRFEGANEFYRRVYDLVKASSWEEKLSDFETFANAPEAQQVEKLSDLFAEIIELEELVLVDDQGGVYQDGGSYQFFFKGLLEQLRGAGRPVVAFSQTRMMPPHLRETNQHSFHTYIPALDDEAVLELTSFSLQDARIDYSERQMTDLVGMLDGHPLNVRLAVSSVKAYGLSAFLDDPSLLVEWKRNRAEDFVNSIEFSDIEVDILRILHEYRFVTYEVLKGGVGDAHPSLGAALRKLEEFCCIERRGSLYLIAPSVQHAIGFDKRFQRTDRFRKSLALQIMKMVDDYTTDESIPVALLESAATASIISDKDHPQVSMFILPSYYVALAGDAYHDDRRKECLELAKKAHEFRSRLSVDGCIEALRLWGLSAIRLDKADELDSAIRLLDQYRSHKIARRNIAFLKGFQLRLKKRYDEAEAEFLKAFRLSPKNASINRELANLYRHQKDYDSAETYARPAYVALPTNAFIIDVLLESLLGKASLGLPVDQSEIDKLFGELGRYGDVPGSSFFQVRMAQDLFRNRQNRAALTAANAAIDRTPEFLPCYILRGDIHLSMTDAVNARHDLDKINGLLTKRGGFSEIDEGRAIDLEIRILIQEGQFKAAREKLVTSLFIPARVRGRLARSLARSINVNPEKADTKSREWARTVIL